MDPSTSTQTYWSILKSFLNNKKIPCIPPLFHNNKFVSDFKSKVELFNSFFANQCTLIQNTSEIPISISRKTDKLLSTVCFTSKDIENIIKNLDPNKAHGHDMISIRMLNICRISVCKPLDIIFTSCMETGKFPAE